MVPINNVQMDSVSKVQKSGQSFKLKVPSVISVLSVKNKFSLGDKKRKINCDKFIREKNTSRGKDIQPTIL